MWALSKFVTYHRVWEPLWHGRCVFKRGAGQKAAPQRYISLLLSSCLPVTLWEGEESLEWNEVQACLLHEFLFCHGTFWKINLHFLSAFTMYVIRLTERHVFFSSCHFFSLASISPPFFFSLQWPSGFHSRRKSSAFVKSLESGGQGLEWLFLSKT